MVRASYRRAIMWMVENDDTEWAENGDPISVSGSLVADLFGKDDEQVRADLRRALKKSKQELRRIPSATQA